MKRVLFAGMALAALLLVALAPAGASLRQAGALSLRISTGTRPAGMGDAFVGLADDYTATHFNPAGLGRYPMSPDWLTYPAPQGRGPIRQIALLRNNVPEQNYKRYDIWALAGNELFRWDGVAWSAGTNHQVQGSETLEGIVSRWVRGGTAGISPERLHEMARLVAETNNRFIYSELVGIKENVLAALPPDFVDSEKEKLAEAFDHLLERFDKALVVPSGLASLKAVSSRALQDQKITVEEASEILSSCRKAISNVMPDQIFLPYNLAFSDSTVRFTSAELTRVKENLLAALPPDSAVSEKKKLAEAFDQLLDRFNRGLVVPYGLLLLKSISTKALEDQKVTAEEISSILASCGQATSNVLVLPHNVAFTDSVVAIAGDERVLWLATQSGVFRFDGESWNSYGVGEGLPEGPFQYLTISPTRTPWLASSKAIFSFSGGHWAISESEEGFPAGGFKRMVFSGERSGWAVSDSDVYHYDGKKWSNRYEVTAGVAPDLAKMIARFVPGLDSSDMAVAVAEVRRLNNLGEAALSTGQKIYFPYRLAFRAPLTAVAIDPAQELWLGTEMGAWRFADGEFTRFGYQPFTVTKEKTMVEVARKFTGDANPQRLARWIDRVKKYNRLASDDLSPGQKLWLYTSPAGSRITAIYANSDLVWLGTEFGVLKFDKKNFERYEPAGLAQAPTADILFKGADGFFATANQVTVYARPWRLVGLMHSNWLPELAQDLFFDSPAYVQHFSGIGTFGLHITFLSLGRNTRIGEGGDTLGYFDSFEGSIGLSYGTRLSQSLSGGMTGKFILSKLANTGAGREIGKGQGTSYALDLGLLYQTPIKRLMLGTAVTNLGPKLQFIDAAQADPLPRNFAFGLSLKLLESAYNRLTLLADFNRDLVSRDPNKSFLRGVFDESIENLGMEYWYGSYFAGRLGYVYDPDGQLKYLTLGTSLQYRNFRFDLAYIPSSKNLALANTLRLALVGKF